MELVPEGPDADAVRARLQELMGRHRREVDGRSPVYGLEQPDLAPRVLVASDSVGVTLHRGELLSSVGPMVSVRTSRGRVQAGSGALVWLTESSVPDQMADEHARLRDHVGVVEPEETAVAVGEGQLWVGDAVLPAELYRDSAVTAARLVLDADAQSPIVVTVITRGVPLDQVRLTVVEDLEPYWEGRETYLAAFAARTPVVRPEDLDLPPSEGLDAHSALVEFCLAENAQVHERFSQGQRPRSKPGAAQQRQRLWEAATRAQMHLADQDRTRANEQVTQIVNQLNSLATRSTWFRDAAARAAAIDQVLGYHVFNADVATREAQRLWQLCWERRKTRRVLRAPLPPDVLQERRRLLEADRKLERQAQHAWDTWASN